MTILHEIASHILCMLEAQYAIGLQHQHDGEKSTVSINLLQLFSLCMPLMDQEPANVGSSTASLHLLSPLPIAHAECIKMSASDYVDVYMTD